MVLMFFINTDSEYRVTPARQVSNEAPAMALCSFFRQDTSAHAAFHGRGWPQHYVKINKFSFPDSS